MVKNTISKIDKKLALYNSKLGIYGNKYTEYSKSHPLLCDVLTMSVFIAFFAVMQILVIFPLGNYMEDAREAMLSFMASEFIGVLGLIYILAQHTIKFIWGRIRSKLSTNIIK